jgi:hypothetical protein
MFGVIMLGRNALAFFRTSKRFQQLIEPFVLKITRMAEVIQNRVQTVTDKSELLQRRVYLLTFSLRMMKIVADAFQKAIEPINRARSYVGL